MNNRIKKQLINQIKKLEQYHSSILHFTDMEEVLSLLTECQRQAIKTGECIERELPSDKKIVPKLELYCEQLFILARDAKLVAEKGIPQIKREPDVQQTDGAYAFAAQTDAKLTVDVVRQTGGEMFTEKVRQLDELLDEVLTLISVVRCQYRVVFLPYKAEMWDALESIWLACREDERCECAVVPIPYFEANTGEKKWEYRYDGERFPEYVPVIHYRDYVIAEKKPDIAYIHNPYDDTNLLTSVYPDYYSKALKEHVSKLVYVPYYVTPGWIAKDHRYFPVYQNMDYMIAQSEYAKECCAGLNYQQKLLPLGSPKLDRAIKKCAEKKELPDEWKEALGGRKIILLNTSIGDVLCFGEKVFQKLDAFFDFVKETKGVGVIWRPHPLLGETLRSMRPELVEVFGGLVEKFRSSGIGVYDTTADVEASLALCDAYIDAGGSSVVNLAGVAGKPIFILDYVYDVKRAEKAHNRIIFTGMTRTEEGIWLTSLFNGLFFLNPAMGELRYVGRNDKEALWREVYTGLAKVGDKLYLCPNCAVGQGVFHLKDSAKLFLTAEEFERKNVIVTDASQSDDAGMLYTIMRVWEDKICYLSYEKEHIAIYCTTTGEWQYYEECMRELWKGTAKELWMSPAFDACIYEGILWITTGYTNRVLGFQIENGEYQVYEPVSDACGYGGIAADENGLWLTDSATGNVLRWDRAAGYCERFEAPDSLTIWKPSGINKTAFSSLLSVGEYFVAIPYFSNSLLRLEKSTGKVEVLAEEFLLHADEMSDGYDKRYLPTVSNMDGRVDESHILVQRMCDREMALIDVCANTYEPIHAILSEEAFEQIADGSDGFEKGSKAEGFWCRESEYFTVDDFIVKLLGGRLDKLKERQREALSVMAANLDGTCGEKVHAFMMNRGLSGEEE